MNLNIFVFLHFILFIFLQYSRANKGAQNRSVKCQQAGGATLVAPNCQSCPEGHCGGDCKIEAAGSTKCVLIVSAQTSTETSSLTKTTSNGLLDMSVVSTSKQNQNVKCEPLGGVAVVAQNCQSCPEGLCGGDCEIEAAGSTKCVLIISTKTSSPKAIQSSISNTTSSSNPTKGPPNIQSMESAKTTEFLATSSEKQGNLNINAAPLKNEITQNLVTGVAMAQVLLK